MIRFPSLLVLLLLLGTAGVCSAGEIVLSAPQDEYFFQVGEKASIPIGVENQGGTDVQGMLTVAVVPADAAQGGGTTQTKSMTIFRDMTALTVDAGTSETAATFALRVSFTSSDGETAVLPAIAVHFIGDQSSVQETGPAARVTSSTSTAATQGSEVQHQGATTIDRAVQAGQTVQDAAALREVMTEEDNATARAKDDLLDRARNDPTVADLDSRLRAEGFAKTGSDAYPETGKFIFFYMKGGSTAASIGGIMDDDLRFARLETAAPLPIPSLLAGNETFSGYLSQLTGDDGLPRGGTIINATHESERLAFSFGEGAAFINATIADGAVRDVSLERSFNWIPLAALMTGLAGALAAAVWRRPKGEKETAPDKRPEPTSPSPSEILALAQKDFAAGETVRAYRGAARALRRQISLSQGSGTEITDEEALLLLGQDSPIHAWVQTTLGICSGVAFAGKNPEEREFKKISEEIGEYCAGSRQEGTRSMRQTDTSAPGATPPAPTPGKKKTTGPEKPRKS